MTIHNTKHDHSTRAVNENELMKVLVHISNDRRDLFGDKSVSTIIKKDLSGQALSFAL
jgi:hypothetical protein